MNRNLIMKKPRVVACTKMLHGAGFGASKILR
jgi:hypothetical protein